MKRILLSLIVLTSIFSFNVLAAVSESDQSSAFTKKAEVHLVMYATTSDGRDITMTGNPGPCDVPGPFADLADLKQFVAQRLDVFHSNKDKDHTILAITALSADESDDARVGINPEGTLIRVMMSDADMAAQMALLNAAISSEGHGAIRAKIQI